MFVHISFNTDALNDLWEKESPEASEVVYTEAEYLRQEKRFAKMQRELCEKLATDFSAKYFNGAQVGDIENDCGDGISFYIALGE